jgi:hypothetical protein
VQYSGALLAVVLARGAERILLVLVGALAVYLGYSLFRHIPGANKAEGKVVLPGGVSIFLTRIGPGIFFALFGIAVIGYSVAQPVNFTVPIAAGAEIKFAGFTERDVRPVSTASAVISSPSPEFAVADLNGFLVLMRDADPQLSPAVMTQIEMAVRSAKFSIMLGQWKPEWGDPAPFQRWAREQGYKDPPNELVPGATAVFYARK